MASCLASGNSLLTSLEYKESFEKYVISREIVQLQKILLISCPSNADLSFLVNFLDLADYDPILAYKVMNYPKYILPLLDETLLSAQKSVLKHKLYLTHKFKKECTEKTCCHVRIITLPEVCTKQNIEELRGGESNSFVQVVGTIVRTSSVRMLEYSRKYKCSNSKCGCIFSVVADMEQDNILIPPRSCPGIVQLTSGNNTSAPRVNNTNRNNNVQRVQPKVTSIVCGCAHFHELESERHYVDYQELKLQDPIDRINRFNRGGGGGGGSTYAMNVSRIPRSITLIVEGSDIVDQFNAGDDVICVGIVVCKWKPVSIGNRCNLDIVFRANSVVKIDTKSYFGGELMFSGCKNGSSFSRDVRTNVIDPLRPASITDQFQIFWDHYKSMGNKNGITDNTSTINSTSFVGRDVIVSSFCPQIHGMYIVKLALLLVLIGGSSTKTTVQDTNNVTAASPDEATNAFDMGAVKSNSYNTVARRHQSHLLLVGDPGTGKSQLLKFASLLVSRAVLTTGIGTTGTGLTCTAYKENSSSRGKTNASGDNAGGQWTLEAGALVLSNDGICCIDEFNCMKESDRTSIHEAMEQQCISVAKAGLVVKLPTRCSILAACNPKGGRYDDSLSITTNLGINSPLLSRFDLILLLLDNPEKEWDKSVSTFLLKQALCRWGNRNKISPHSLTPPHHDDSSNHDFEKIMRLCPLLRQPLWDVHTLQQYITYLRSDQVKQPVQSKESQIIITRYYQQQRQQRNNNGASPYSATYATGCDGEGSGGSNNTLRVTIRLLESLLRLSEAHAKLMCKEVVTLEDAVVAIWCVRFSQQQQQQQQSGLSSQSGLYCSSVLHSGFPSSPEEYYTTEVEAPILSMLNYSRFCSDATRDGGTATSYTLNGKNMNIQGGNKRGHVDDSNLHKLVRQYDSNDDTSVTPLTNYLGSVNDGENIFQEEYMQQQRHPPDCWKKKQKRQEDFSLEFSQPTRPTCNELVENSFSRKHVDNSSTVTGVDVGIGSVSPLIHVKGAGIQVASPKEIIVVRTRKEVSSSTLHTNDSMNDKRMSISGSRSDVIVVNKGLLELLDDDDDDD